MGKTRRIGMIWMVCLTLILGLALCGDGQAAPKKGGIIVEAMGTEPTNLDTFKARRQPELRILHMILEPLVVINPSFKIEPLLAESWKASKDAKTWTFTLKKGIKFHNGEPFNAEAVKFSLEKHLKGTVGPKIKVVDSIEAKDEYTVVLHLKQPYPELLLTLASFECTMIPPKGVTEAKTEWGSKVVIGTGPMMFKEWKSGERVILVRNPDYKHAPSFVSNKGPAYVDEYHFRFLVEPATLIAELTAGDVDLSAYVTERDVNKVKEDARTAVIMGKSTSAIYLAINMKKAPFDDIKVREALTRAVDAEAVRRAAMSGVAAPLYTPLSPSLLGYWPGAEEGAKPLVKYDPAQSKQILEAAGWKDSGKGYREKGGQPLEVNFLAFNIARYKRMAEVVTPMLEAAGFKVDLKILEAGDLYERVLKGEHHLLSTGFVTSQGVAIDDLVLMFHSSSIGMITQWSYYVKPEVDKLLDLARYDVDAKKRADALKKVQEIVAKDFPVVPIGNAMEIFGYKKTLGGVENYTKHPWCHDQVNAYRALELYKQ
jgi:peptide/nickel transport system substrate-binding protein